MKGLIFLKKLPFMGSGVAIVTPFNEDNEVNYDIFEELIEMPIYFASYFLISSSLDLK